MRTRRVILGALALTVGLSGPALAIWEGIDPIHPIMPKWTWDGIESQDRMRHLPMDEQRRLEQMAPAERERAMRTMEQRLGQRRGDSQTHRMMPRETLDEMQRRTEGGGAEEPKEDRGDRSPGSARPDSGGGTGGAAGQSSPEGDDQMRQDKHPETPESGGDGVHREPGEGGEPTTPEMREERTAPGSGARGPQGRGERQSAESNVIRQEVQLKPTPKEIQPPAPGEPMMPDHPVDAARAHIGMAHTSVLEQDWDAARNHVRQAEESLNRIERTGNRNVDRYLESLKSDMKRAEQEIGNRSREAENHLERLDTNLRSMRPEAR
ncbi:MAG: hypothetical protein H7338_13580 [Candidatus Sericytochromatia bacterium]|nr:hypothetical protein [Candidatus Sericytochromatia bacterium]